MKPKLILLVANIAAGKSTLARKLAKCGYYVLSLDGFRYMLGGGDYVFDSIIEDEFYKPEEFFLKWLMAKRVNIIVDDAKNVNSVFRARLIGIAKLHGYEVIVIDMPKYSMKKSVDRRIQNPHSIYNRKIWEQTYRKFKRMYEEPKFEEGIDHLLICKTTEAVNLTVLAFENTSVH